MWLKRILDSLIGVRSKAELENDLKKVTLTETNQSYSLYLI